jgi:hypothetical protein
MGVKSGFLHYLEWFFRALLSLNISNEMSHTQNIIENATIEKLDSLFSSNFGYLEKGEEVEDFVKIPDFSILDKFFQQWKK